MRRQARRESSRAWIASGATVTIKTYAHRYGVDRYTAYEDLTATGFPLPDSARRWEHRPSPQLRPRPSATPRTILDNDWIMMDARPYFVAGYTLGGAPYGIYLDEMDDDYLLGADHPGHTRPAVRLGSIRSVGTTPPGAHIAHADEDGSRFRGDAL